MFGSSGWVTLFIVSQLLISFVFMWHRLTTDYSFTKRFVDLFTPLIDKYPIFMPLNEETIRALAEVILPFTTPTLLITGILVMGVFILRIRKKEKKPIRKITVYQILQLIMIGIGINLLLTICMELVPKSLLETHSLFTTSLAKKDSFLITLLTVGVVGPITEEIIFRYGVQTNLSALNVKLAIIMQAIMFGMMHGNIVQSAYGIILGLLFGYCFYQTKNLLIPIILHIAINSSSVLILHLSNSYWDFLILLFVAGCLGYIVKIVKRI